MNATCTVKNCCGAYRACLYIRAEGWPPLTPACDHKPRGACNYCTPGSGWVPSAEELEKWWARVRKTAS